MIKVQNEVEIYEIDGSDKFPKVGEKAPKPVIVESHWNIDRFIVLKVDGAKAMTVLGRDLIQAVQNAMATNRF